MEQATKLDIDIDTKYLGPRSSLTGAYDEISRKR